MPGTRPGMTVFEERCVTYGVWRPHPSRGWYSGQQTSSWSGEATKLRFAPTSRPWFVMAGLVPAIHVLGAASKCVDTRHKAGHDGVEKRCVTYGVWRPHPSRGWYSGQQTSSWSGEATKLRFAPTSRPWFVMAGLVPAIHVLGAASKCVDTRHKAGHDGVEGVVTRSAFTRVGSLPCSVMAGRGDDASVPAVVPAVVRHGRARRRSFASRRRPGHPRSWCREQVRGYPAQGRA